MASRPRGLTGPWIQVRSNRVLEHFEATGPQLDRRLSKGVLSPGRSARSRPWESLDWILPAWSFGCSPQTPARHSSSVSRLLEKLTELEGRRSHARLV